MLNHNIVGSKLERPLQVQYQSTFFPNLFGIFAPQHPQDKKNLPKSLEICNKKQIACVRLFKPKK